MTSILVHSTKPKPKEKEYVVAFIGKNRWRLPPGSDQTTAAQPSSSSSGDQGKTEEELRLDREAAEAVLKGKGLHVIACSVLVGGGEHRMYRIARKFGGELNLAVWRSILQLSN